MKAKKALSVIIMIVNVIGIVCLIYFSIPFLTHSTVVNNPDAMLPMEEWDGAGMTLTIGFLPLLIANLCEFFVSKGKLKTKLRLLFFIPSLICIGLVISYFIISFR